VSPRRESRAKKLVQRSRLATADSDASCFDGPRLGTGMTGMRAEGLRNRCSPRQSAGAREADHRHLQAGLLSPALSQAKFGCRTSGTGRARYVGSSAGTADLVASCQAVNGVPPAKAATERAILPPNDGVVERIIGQLFLARDDLKSAADEKRCLMVLSAELLTAVRTERLLPATCPPHTSRLAPR
jgi:hypothetical protein